MFEKCNEPLASKATFILRLLWTIFFATLIIAIALFMGMLGYHTYEGMSWLDAFLNAAMILSGMGPVSTLVTAKGKFFAGCYALFSGLLFIMLMGLIFAPIFHRFFHKFHLESDDDAK